MTNVGEILQSITEQQRRIAELADVDRGLDIDAGLLSAWDPNPVTVPKSGPKREEYLKTLTRDNLQTVLNKLNSLETEIVDGERVLRLPEPATVLPRAKRPPEPKPPTKWEKFARSKGIKSHRDKLIWDEFGKKWVPRYGYKKAQYDRERECPTQSKD